MFGIPKFVPKHLLVPERLHVPTKPNTITLPLPCFSFRRQQWGWKIDTPDGVYWHPNVFMNEAKESIVDRNIDLLADTLKCALLTATAVLTDPDKQFIDEAGAADFVDGRAAGTTDQTLAGKAIGKDLTGDFAYFDANDSAFVGVAAGAAITQVGAYKDTGVATTSKILCVFDIVDVTPNGGDITIQWAAPASGGMLKLA